MAGTHVVIDLANSPSFEDKAVLEFSPGLFQPIAADDVAAIVADVALAAPRNGIVEIAGHDAIVPPPVDRARRRMDVVDACGSPGLADTRTGARSGPAIPGPSALVVDRIHGRAA